jgi:RNA polymerase sigma-70 factor (ECF subfamily)
MNRPDDKELVREIINGNRTAFETLLVRYEKPVFNAAYRMLNNAEDARDVTQTVFLKAYENLDRFDPKYRFFSWIYRIALNESIDCLKSQNRTDSLVAEPATETRGPEDETSRNQQSLQIQSALMMIKTEYRTVIVLKHFLDCNYLVIGRILVIPEAKVKSRLYTARQILKDALQNMHRNS